MKNYIKNLIVFCFINSSVLICMEDRPVLKKKHQEEKAECIPKRICYIKQEKEAIESKNINGQRNDIFTLSALNYAWLLENVFDNETDLLEWVNRNKNLARASFNTWTIFHAAVEGGLIELVKHLVHEQEVNIDAESFNGYTPLYFAILNNHVKMVKLLIELDADIKVAKGKYYNTPLHLAAQEGNPKIINILLDKGANAVCPNKNGKISLNIAFENECIEAFILLYKHISDIEEIGFDIYLTEKDRIVYMLYRALSENNYDAVLRVMQSKLSNDRDTMSHIIKACIKHHCDKEIVSNLVFYLLQALYDELNGYKDQICYELCEYAIREKYNIVIEIINEYLPNFLKSSRYKYKLLNTAIIFHNNEITKMIADKETISCSDGRIYADTYLFHAVQSDNIYATKLLIDLRANFPIINSIHSKKNPIIAHLLSRYELQLEGEKALKNRAAKKIQAACKAYIQRVKPTCAICLDAILRKERIETQCKHQFHQGCLQHWLEGHNTCPICRAKLFS